MQLTKFTHACVRIEIGGATIVIDPGVWAESEALDGADAVLITHEHADHEFVRAVTPARAFPIHEALLNDRGIEFKSRWIADQGGTDYRVVRPGETA